MKATGATWARVNRARPCPVCGKPDWCLLAPDGSAAICPRIESPKRVGEAGYLHRLGPSEWRAQRVRRVTLPEPHTARELGELADRFSAAARPAALERFARELGVSDDALRQFGAGWDGEAWCFPMQDSAGRIIGIRRRFPDGRKLSVPGGREGVFVPAELPGDGLLLVAEGPTDAAGLLTLGFACIGRPSCRGGVKLVRPLARGRDAVIVADGDEPGRRGAETLARVLALYCPRVRVIRPPAGLKDARAWVQAGATRADVLAAIQAAEPVRIGIRVRTAGRKPAV